MDRYKLPHLIMEYQPFWKRSQLQPSKDF